MREPVKGVSEAGRRREARALATRDRVVAAARNLFETNGYVATSVIEIARAAGAAPATVYQAFGTKHAILVRALDQDIAEDSGPLGVLDRPWLDQVRATDDAHRRLELIVNKTSRIAARTAPLKRVMRDAAAVDPAVCDLINDDHQRRLSTQTALVKEVLAVQPLRAGLGHDAAVATYFGLVSSDSYLLMTEHLGWSLEQWQRWLTATLFHALFQSDVGPQRTP